MPAPLSALNTTAMIARMVHLLAKANQVPVVVVVTVVRLATSSADLLLRLGQIQQSNYRKDLMDAVGLYLSMMMTQWLI